MTFFRLIPLIALAALIGCSESTGEVATFDAEEFRQFEVDGVAVWVRSSLRELPQNATAIEAAGTVIDSGEGPELCIGGVNESLPPQCSGPILVGLPDGWWTDSAAAVQWGELNVSVSWPPVDGRVSVIEEGQFTEWPDPEHPTRKDLPRECAGIDQFVAYEQLRSWETANPDRGSLVRLVEDSAIAVLAVDGDVEAVREELAEGDLVPCVVPYFTKAELDAAFESILPLMESDLRITSMGPGNAYDRVTVEVFVADVATVTKIVADVENPEVVLITGTARIIDGT